MVFDPNGAILAALPAIAGGSNDLQLWNVATHKPIGNPFADSNGGITEAQFNQKGTILATIGQDGQVQMWNVATHKPIGNPLASGTSAVESIAFSPDGTGWPPATKTVDCDYGTLPPASRSAAA